MAEQKQLTDFLVFPAGRIGDWPIQQTTSGEKVSMPRKSTKDLHFGDRESAERDRAIEHWEPKWKSQVRVRSGGDYAIELGYDIAQLVVNDGYESNAATVTITAGCGGS
jgi:hypothetical protein